VDSSTVSPMLARRVADACAERGIEFLDAPVTGGTWGAEKGELTIMVGGPTETLAHVEPVFAPLAKRVIHIGPNGTGQTVKLAMNLLLALEVDALVEALALATAGGVAGERLVEVMQASMGRAPLLDVKAPLILEHKFPPSFPLRLMHKDLTLALDLAKQLGVSLPVGTAAREAYDKVLRNAHEDLDYAAVALYYQKADGQSG
jgi:3-hydroxyisobutyrate dehydrogenase-like beta-hydroxyacid dehydrogenase